MFVINELPPKYRYINWSELYLEMVTAICLIKFINRLLMLFAFNKDLSLCSRSRL